MKVVKIHGGLGNQMFQYAFYLALNNYYVNEEIKIDSTIFDTHQIHNGFELPGVFPSINDVNYYTHLDKKLVLREGRNFLEKLRFSIFKDYEIFIEKGLKYEDTVFSMYNSTIFEGFWQSEKYFHSIKNKVLNRFMFTSISKEKNLSLLKKIRNSESVSIHIRLGDYRYNNVNCKVRGDICTKSYYQGAVSLLQKKLNKPTFFVFSDEPHLVKNWLPDIDYTLVDWNRGTGSYRDMQLMSLCRHHIIANSSFSWWGAYLNKNPEKMVVSPPKWFNDNTIEYNLDDIIPSSWLKLADNQF